jgi:RimJ/RimL family protein N-acetyltransferase
MHQYIFGQDRIIADFAAQLIPECRLQGFGNCRAIGIASAEGELLGALVYNNWSPQTGTIEMSIAAIPGTNWLSRRTLQVGYGYPFDICGCQMVICTVAADNEMALRIMAATGFTLHKIARLRGENRDGVIGTLTAEDWDNSRYNLNRRQSKPEQYQPLLEEAA